jgi:hypothetical protein
VTALPCGATVLIVDRDLGFVFWIGEIFNEVGCHAVPALDCTEAISITKELNLRIDLVVVNPQLPGVADMVRTLQSPSLKIIAIRDRRVQAIRTFPVDAILERPSGSEPISRERWLDRVRKILRDFHLMGAA